MVSTFEAGNFGANSIILQGDHDCAQLCTNLFRELLNLSNVSTALNLSITFCRCPLIFVNRINKCLKTIIINRRKTECSINLVVLCFLEPMYILPIVRSKNVYSFSTYQYVFENTSMVAHVS